MDSKEETSDTDSGIILQSGPDSPASPVKELVVHTRAVRLKHKALEDRLERCLQELKQLCIREAELTGKMPPEYPLQPGETPPDVRRCAGATYVLIEDGIHLEDQKDLELMSLESRVALQQQILQTARKLCFEEHLSRSVRRSRLQQCKREEVKLRELQRTLSQNMAPCSHSAAKPRDPRTSEGSLLCNTVLGEEELVQSQLSLRPPEPPHLSESSHHLLQSLKQCPPQTLELPRDAQKMSMGYERSPIQNSPWSESSLDQPYHKCRKPHSAGSSHSCSPTVTPSSTPLDPQLRDTSPLPPPLGLAVDDGEPSSAPCTPELHQRHAKSQSFRLPKYEASDKNVGPARLPRRRASDFAMSSPRYPSSSEDSSSEHSVPSNSGSPCRKGPNGILKPPPPPYGYHLLARQNGPYANAPRIIGNHSSIPYGNSFNSNGPETNFPHSKHFIGYRDGVQALCGSGFCKHPQVQSTASKGCAADEGVYPGDLEKGCHYLGVPPPLIHALPCQFTNWQGEGLSQQVPRAPPPHVRLARGPSLKEYIPYPGRGASQGLVCEELHSWRKRTQTRESQAQSQDYLAIEREHQDQPVCIQAPRRQILLRAPDGTPVQWFEEKDCEIVSQV